MASRALEAEIDRLYQLPLDEFTPARNALAKTAAGEAARIRALSKPPIAAWAVNQLYWRNADVWNALVEAAGNAQRAHRAVLAGKAGDVRAASKVHDDAVERALKATLALLADADQPATDATKHAIGTTLRALPGDEPPGRLTRLLQPAGFGMLTGLSIAPAATKPPKPAPARGASAPPTPSSQPKVDVKALTRARHAAEAATRALRDAEGAARREEFERVRTEREETRAAEAVEKAREALKRATSDLEHAEAAATAATRLREATAQRALAAQKALSSARSRAEAAAAEVKTSEKGVSGRSGR
jgi:hypothetical protein